MQTKNIFLFLLKSPIRLFELASKVISRITDNSNSLSLEQHSIWLNSKTSDFEEFANSLNPLLWKEAKIVSHDIEVKSKKILSTIKYDLGGGGIYPIIYFLIRLKQPNCIVETGVAAGFSSQSILLAIEKNGKGVLFSSDFPYFRIPNPETFIGVLVEERLKKNWHLFTKGDKINLPEILDLIKEIDFFHFDSDKSYKGRVFATKIIRKKLSNTATLIYDDINDNTHFYDYVLGNNIQNYKIFKFGGKYVGLISN